ncbi:MAG: glycosyltransferase family 2 protein [Gammaproteobacteria bacterium]
MSILKPDLSIILPANNEAEALPGVLTGLKSLFPDAELIVVDDGSSDATAQLAEAGGANVIRHRYPTGNGAAIKSGARAARGKTLIFMDADGQHSAEDAQRLLAMLDSGYDMVVGARDGASQASLGRKLANGFYNKLASWIVGHRIADLTSGFRAVDAVKFREFIYLLPNGFSYPTTSTMAFFRAGYHVAYAPIVAQKRKGKSHIRPFQDGLRFLLIIFRIGTLYSPLKLFLPFSLAFFLTGLGYYFYTLLTAHRFTNMSALLFITAILVFLIGLVSEQITNLIYRPQS